MIILGIILLLVGLFVPAARVLVYVGGALLLIALCLFLFSPAYGYY